MFQFPKHVKIFREFDVSDEQAEAGGGSGDGDLRDPIALEVTSRPALIRQYAISFPSGSRTFPEASSTAHKAKTFRQTHRATPSPCAAIAAPFFLWLHLPYFKVSKACRPIFKSVDFPLLLRHCRTNMGIAPLIINTMSSLS